MSRESPGEAPTAAPTAERESVPYHALAVDAVLLELGVDPDRGLSRAQVRRRRVRHGLNVLRALRRESAWKVAVRQFESPIVWLLLVALALSFAFDQRAEAGAIAAVVALNGLIGFFTELKAVRSMEALRQLGRVSARVRRNGKTRRVPAQALVPGDILLFEGGDVITADLRLVESAALASDEAALTGESVPVPKVVEPVAADAPLSERASMLFKGAAVTRGSGAGVVTATGMATELGRISALIEEIEDVETPLEKRLDRLSGQLLWVTLALAAAIGIAGAIAGRPLLLMVETAVALAVAAVPEGLPMVSTLALGRGMWRMARRNALIESLPAVETLGATTIICTDKTGTLTENRMAVTSLVDAKGRVDFSHGDGEAMPFGDGTVPSEERIRGLRDMLTAGALCNNATLEARPGERPHGVGDPLEVAVLAAASRAGIEASDLLRQWPERREVAFDPATKMMATVHDRGEDFLVAVKGAPESVLSRASSAGAAPLTASDRQRWLGEVDALAASGIRVLGVARKSVRDAAADPYVDLEFLGLIGLRDPPRPDAAEAVRRCREAGIRVVMVTGDHGLTARAIAREVGIADADTQWESGRALDRFGVMTEEEESALNRVAIFARVTPEQKLRLVEFYQRAGEVVAMTGDGVNDAPALKKADIGIAMGLHGTQVAREAADMVLRDDMFSTIVAAIEQGRVIFANIRAFVVYLLSCNLSELLVVGAATVAGLPLPILPLQILFLNLVTDVFPAFALGAGEGGQGVMQRLPREPKEGVLEGPQWVFIAAGGVTITAATLGALIVAQALALSGAEAVTVSFLTLAFAQLWHVFTMRDAESRFLINEVTANPYVWGALALCVALLLGAAYWPPAASVLSIAAPGGTGWSIILIASVFPVVASQVVRLIRFGRPSDG